MLYKLNYINLELISRFTICCRLVAVGRKGGEVR